MCRQVRFRALAVRNTKDAAQERDITQGGVPEHSRDGKGRPFTEAIRSSGALNGAKIEEEMKSKGKKTPPPQKKGKKGVMIPGMPMPKKKGM